MHTRREPGSIALSELRTKCHEVPGRQHGLHKHLILSSVFMAVFASGTALAACHQGGPTGRYEGTVISAQAGTLDVILNLRCAQGAYAGIVLSPVGTFKIRDGSFCSGKLQIAFDAGNGTGTIDLNSGNGLLRGTFALADDHGPVTLARVGDAVANDDFTPTMAISRAHWRDDLAYFARELPKRHANAFHRVTQPKFEAAVARLAARIGRLNPDQTYVELDRLATMIGDAHTYVMFPPDHANLPLEIARFGKDYRVTSAAPEYRATLGATVLAIGKTPVSEACRRLIQITPRDETQSLREGRVESFLTIGMMLHGTGITGSRDKVSFLLQADAGRPFRVSVTPLPVGAQVAWKHVYPAAPLYKQHEGESFWCAVPMAATVYCNFHGYDGLADRAEKMFALIDQTKPDKLIVDMRDNPGGDFTEGLKYIIEPIAGDPRLNRRGHLFVLIDEGVFSAGMSNSAQFRTQTKALLVGQAIGERPNTYQEAREMMLPNSHLRVRYSTKFYRFVAAGKNMIEPDVPIATSWADYKAGRDPVLEWVLSH